MVNIGIVGCGGIARHHVNYLKPMDQAAIVAVFDVDRSAAESMVEHAGGNARVYDSFEQLLGHEPLDAVMVCTPTAYHHEPAAAALAAGKHVFCEKPIARTMEQCQRILDAAEASKGTLTVGYVRRFDNEWNTMGQIVRSGRLGRPVIWRFCSGAWHPRQRWFCDERIGGGPLIDGAVHNYDFALQLFGPARQVLAVGQTWNQRDNTALDTGSVIVEFASGDQLVLVWTWGLAEGAGCEGLHDVVGPNGGIKWGLAPDEYPDGVDPARFGGFLVRTPGPDGGPVVFERNDMFAEQMKHWVEALEQGRSPLVTGEDGRRSLQLALAVLEAMRVRGAVPVG